ncbi:MAG: potassium-transporting ATPase subunit KdpC [Pseudomonadota bacterium]|nr:potassium-transporting ATPase subunit KdpC [Pseudomonadota bacterium]
MKGLIRPVLVVFLALSVLTGIAYPLLVTLVARVAFPVQAAGSLLMRGGKPVGSTLIGQNFSDPKYFWGRPSATSPQPYNALNSGGSNLGPLNPALAEAVRARIEVLRAADPANAAPVPVDLVTASASGLDPHLSIAGARFQVARVARVRGLPADQVQRLVDRTAQPRQPGLPGEPTVNVLLLNLALDEAAMPQR